MLEVGDHVQRLNTKNGRIYAASTMTDPPPPKWMKESKRIIDAARDVGATLRLIGGLGVRTHCNELKFCDREHGDIDLAGLSRDSDKIIEILQSMGYRERRTVTFASGGNRLLFENTQIGNHVDIFLDKLRMEHEINLKERLKTNEYTVSVSDLLLGKLIIYHLTEKDYRDIFTLLKDLEVGESDAENMLNLRYLASLCAKDWGLYVDVLTSIEKCKSFLPNYEMDKRDRENVEKKLNLLEKRIKTAPKSIRWRIRAFVGTKLPIRRNVEEENLKSE
jgi:hypothetical protein